MAKSNNNMKSYIRLKYIYASLLFVSLFQFSQFSAYSQSDDYNIKIGDLLIDFSVFVQYSYNDNVTTIPEGVPDLVDPTIIGPRSDFILAYGANIGFEWQISDSNTLGLVLGMTYEDYSELDYMDSQKTFFSVQPESELDFTVLLGPVEIRVYDKFGYKVDGSNAALVNVVDDSEDLVNDDGIPIVRGRSISVQVDRYAAWTNEFGIEALTILNPIEWTLGLRRFDLIPDDNDGDEYVDELGRNLVTDRWEFTRRTEWILDTQLYYPLGRDNGFGISGRYSFNDYKREVLADSNGWQIAASVDWSLGDKTALSATVGYDVRDFDKDNTLRYAQSNGGGYADILDGKNLFYSIEVLNLLGDSFNHKLSFTKAIGLGRVTNEQVTTTIAWDFLFEGIRKIDLTGGVQWITSEDSGPSQYAEDYDLVMATLGLDIKLTESLNSTISYRYLDKDSDDDDRDFKQSVASISLHYDF